MLVNTTTENNNTVTVNGTTKFVMENVTQETLITEKIPLEKCKFMLLCQRLLSLFAFPIKGCYQYLHFLSKAVINICISCQRLLSLFAFPVKGCYQYLHFLSKAVNSICRFWGKCTHWYQPLAPKALYKVPKELTDQRLNCCHFHLAKMVLFRFRMTVMGCSVHCNVRTVLIFMHFLKIILLKYKFSQLFWNRQVKFTLRP